MLIDSVQGLRCLDYFSNLRAITETFTAAGYAELSVRPAWHCHPRLGSISVGLMLEVSDDGQLDWQQGRDHQRGHPGKRWAPSAKPVTESGSPGITTGHQRNDTARPAPGAPHL